MNSGLRLWLPIFLVSSVLALGLAPSAKADAIYTLGVFRVDTFSFQVPGIITGTPFANITNVQSTPPFPCSVSSVLISGPDTLSPNIVTFLDPPCGALTSIFSEPINHFGTFNGLGGDTLTISEATPEPSSLLLLASGLTYLFGLRRKRIG